MLVILAAVSISAVYNSNIVGYAVNGATNYAGEATRENEILDQTASIIQSAVDKISDIVGGNTGENPGGDEGEEPETPPEETEEPIKGIDFGNLSEDEKEGLIGQYVAYTPVSGSFTSEKQYNGYSDLEFSTQENLKWRILFIEDNKLKLISDTITNSGFYLLGVNGYNNGVLLINNACKAMYSNNSFGAIGRNLNIEDVEKISTHERATETSISTIYRYYPNIFAQEISGNLGRSEQLDYFEGYTQSPTDLQWKETYYTYTMTTNDMSSIYLELFNYQPGTTTNFTHSYWLASRCVEYYDVINYYFRFKMFYVVNSTLDANILYISSNNNSTAVTAFLRPVVEVDLSKVYVGETGTGDVNDAYSIVAR